MNLINNNSTYDFNKDLQLEQYADLYYKEAIVGNLIVEYLLPHLPEVTHVVLQSEY